MNKIQTYPGLKEFTQGREDRCNLQKYSFIHVLAEMYIKCSEGTEVQAIISSLECHRGDGTSGGS